MKKGMCITYEVDSGLYINITNRCSNRCEFCIRNNGDGAYGSESLWLMREPSVFEVFAHLNKIDLGKYSEAVFCGYGEPTFRLREAAIIALYIKAKRPDLPVRINTNGHSDLIFGEDTASLYKGAFDSVSISLNAPSSDRYEAMCHPVYKKEAFDAVLNFAKNVKKYVQNVSLSVVREYLLDGELEECERISRECGVALKVRTYIPPEK